MPAILEVDNITKSFGGVRAVDGASFRLAAPGIYGLIGPNGAGKTTLFDVICGRQFADTGHVQSCRQRIDHLRVHQRARLGLGAHLSGMPRARSGNLPRQCTVCRAGQAFRQRDDAGNQPPHRCPPDRVAEEAERLLDLVNLRRLANEPAGNLSFGQRRLLEIVSSLIARPRLLLLDEPASGINPTLLNTLHDFLLRIFAERQIVLLVVEHNMEFIMSLASHILVMHQGRVLEEGPPGRHSGKPTRDRSLSRLNPMLEVRALEVGYSAGRRIVNGVDLRVDAGEMVTVIGQNGAGKSTLLKGIFNVAPFRSGDVVLDGASVLALPAPKLILAGLAYVPQNRSLFPKLTVAENLRLGGFLLRDRGLLERRLDELQALFPILAERRRDYAASLSGGEQRLLEIARTLIMEPKRHHAR